MFWENNIRKIVLKKIFVTKIRVRQCYQKLMSSEWNKKRTSDNVVDRYESIKVCCLDRKQFNFWLATRVRNCLIFWNFWKYEKIENFEYFEISKFLTPNFGTRIKEYYCFERYFYANTSRALLEVNSYVILNSTK